MLYRQDAADIFFINFPIGAQRLTHQAANIVEFQTQQMHDQQVNRAFVAADFITILCLIELRFIDHNRPYIFTRRQSRLEMPGQPQQLRRHLLKCRTDKNQCARTFSVIHRDFAYQPHRNSILEPRMRITQNINAVLRRFVNMSEAIDQFIGLVYAFALTLPRVHNMQSAGKTAAAARSTPQPVDDAPIH